MKHQPATPLPWKMDQCSYVYGYVLVDGGMLQSRYILGSAPLPMQDRDYVQHAANAYPRLVEALKQSRAAFRDSYLRGVEIQQCEKRGSRAALAGLEMSRYAESGEKDTVALLRELGEEA